MGICGEDSSLVITVPLIAGELQRRRPDVRVHVLLENAGSMLPIHREAITEMLGVNMSSHAPVVDAAGWTAFTRRRTLFATVADDERWTPPRRPRPWDAGWSPAAGRGATMATMTRSRARAGEPLRASTYQYAPRYLMIQHGSRCDCPPYDLGFRIRDFIPVHLRAAYRHIQSGFLTTGTGQATDDATRWFAVHGEAFGVRVPNVSERGRAMGMLPYLRSLGLTDTQIYNAQGNSFDRAIVGLRLGPIVARWLAGGDIPTHVFPTPHTILNVYRRVYANRLAAGWAPTMDRPVPPAVRVAGDLRRISIAAEHGREGQ